MTIEELERRLREIVGEKVPVEYEEARYWDVAADPEAAHQKADDLLVEFIGSGYVKRVYKEAGFWYA